MPERADVLINGRYRLISVIGQGAMGIVWRGHDEVLGREVAIKKIILSADLDELEHAELKALAMQEARATAALSHPGVITVFDVIEDDGAPVIVMELIEGRSLAEVLREQVRLPWRRVAEIGAAMVDALGEAHAAGIVHRDLKPANVLLAGRRVVITDFGIAARSGERTAGAPGEVSGTPAFMSPEQAENAAASPAADLWSLGATLFNAVEGVPPFQGPDYASVLLLLLSQDPPRPAHAGPLTSLISSLLSKDPVRRPAADQVTDELATILRDGTASPAPAPAPAAPAPAPRPAVPAAANAGVVRKPRTVSKSRAARKAAARKTAGTRPAANAQAVRRTAATHTPRPGQSRTTSATPQLPLKRPARSAGRLGWGMLAGLGVVGLVASLIYTSEDHRHVGAHKPSRSLPAGVVAEKPGATLSGPLAFSPTGDTFAVGESLVAGPGGFVDLFDASDGVRLGEIPTGLNGMDTLAFSPDGARLAIGDDHGGIELWDVATRKRVATTSVSPSGGADELYALEYSRDGKSIFTCDDSGRYGKWTIGAGKPTTKEIPGHAIRCLALNPSGTTLTAMSSSTLNLWRNLNGHLKATPLAAPWPSSTATVSNTAFSPDGRTLAVTRYDPGSSASDSGPGIVEIWNVASRTRLASHDLTVYKGGGLAFSPDSTTLAATASNGDITVWKLGVYQSSKTIPAQFEGGPDHLALSGDHLAAAGNDNTIRLWDLKTGSLTASWPAGN